MRGKIKYISKATIDKKNEVRYIVVISFISIISCIGFAFSIVNFYKGNFFYAIDYLIAVILGFAIVMIKINTAFPIYIAIDDEKIYMKTWDNHFLPYDINHKMLAFCDFVPAKVQLINIPIENICDIVVGTKNYVKRNCNENEEFLDKITKLEKLNIFCGKSIISSLDLFYVTTKDGKCHFMSISRFDTNRLAHILNAIKIKNKNVIIMCNNKKIKQKINN